MQKLRLFDGVTFEWDLSDPLFVHVEQSVLYKEPTTDTCNSAAVNLGISRSAAAAVEISGRPGICHCKFFHLSFFAQLCEENCEECDFQRGAP